MSEYITKDAILNKTVNKNHAWLYTTNAEGKNLKEIVDELPSTDVRPNIHGHWKKVQKGITAGDFSYLFKCSCCNYELFLALEIIEKYKAESEG